MRNGLENKIKKIGRIYGIVGPMFSGKTTSLLREYERAIIGKKQIMIFKPKLDTRYGKEYVSTHLGFKVEAIPVKNSKELFDKYILKKNENKYKNKNSKRSKKIDKIFIDEIQFFDSGIIDIITKITKDSVDVHWCGLNKDYRAKPFSFYDGKEHIGALMAISDYLSIKTAVCEICGNDAEMTFRKTNNNELIQIGNGDTYEARCKEHYYQIPTKK